MADTDKKAAEEVAKPEAEAKTAEPDKAEEAAPKEPEEPKELEEDAKPLKGKKLKDGSVAFSAADATLNVMPSLGGKILMSLADDGFQHLLACARANVGVKTGRYMFEVRILESRVSAPNQKHVVRVGFSLAGTSLFLTDTEDSVSFDSDGVLVCEKKRTRPGQCRFTKASTHVAVLLNREAGSPNEETISIFIAGARACEPQKLPEAWKGKTLYPTINYKHVTVEANFGPEATCPLPFSCHMLAGAATSDVEVSTVKEPAKAEVLIPVGLPNQGVADWVEDFVQKNPTYVELSSRAMTQWALKSGATNPKMDDFSLMQFLKAVAPVLKKKYVLMEVKSNLIAKEREIALKGFLGADFKKVAAVIMGEPTAEYKEKVKGFILEEKTKLAVIEMEKKKAEASRKRAAAERFKKAEAAKKARLAAAQKKKDGDDDKAEEKEEEEEKPTEEEEIKMEPVELTEEEKKIWYRSSSLSEIPEHILAKVFVSFSLPEKTEGFDDIQFLWQPAKKCAEHLTEYILSRKLTSRVEDLQPGEWFKTNSKEFQTWFASLKKRQNEWKNPAQKKALLAKIIAAKTEKKEAGEGDEKKEETPPVELPEVNAEDLEPLEVTDVMDIGSGEPLFASFASEDWELLSLRAEFLFLVHGFKKDMNDPERTGFHESHTSFYYQKYFKKNFDFKQYGQSSLSDFISLIKDTITLNSQGILEAVLPEDAPKENLVKLAEEHRRDRQRRVDAGDETAELKFKKPQQPSFAPAANKRPYQGGGKGSIQPGWTANKQPRHLQPVRR